MIQIKKFFKPADKSETDNSETVSGQNDPNFHKEPKFTSPVTRAMKKLLEQQNVTNLVISVLCECVSGNRNVQTIHFFSILTLPANLLKNANCGSSMCAKCKLQLFEHLNNHQADNTANKINISEHLSIKKQCHDYNSDAVPNSIDIFPFQDFNSCKLIKEQDAVHDKKEDAQNLIKGDTLKLQVQFF